MSRSVRSFANASSSTDTPLIGMSALAVATMRPDTLGLVGGRKTSSTPSGMTWIISGSTPKSLTMSFSLEVDTVKMRPQARATRPCIFKKPYQRRNDNRLRKLGAASKSILLSKVIGWWMLVISGIPDRLMSSIP